MTCDVTSFPAVFQSYQDDRRVIMKGCVQWNPVYKMKRSPPQVGLEPRTSAVLLQIESSLRDTDLQGSLFTNKLSFYFGSYV